MNRKKITLLLTGLAVASSMFMGCSSSSNNNSSNGSGNVAQENGGLRRATDRTVTDYNGDEYNAGKVYEQYPSTNAQENGYSYPDVAYADDITGIDNGNGIMSGVGGETNNTQYIDDNYTGNNGTNNVGINGGNTPNTNPSLGVTDYGTIPSNDFVESNNINSATTQQTPMNGLNGFGDTTQNNGMVNNMIPNTRTSESNIDNGVNDSLTNIVTPGVGGATEGLGEIPSITSQESTTDIKSEKNTSQSSKTTTTKESTGYDVSMNTRAAQQNIAGKITPVRSIGGVELTGAEGSEKPQGTIQVSFTLSGDVLNTVCSSASSSKLSDLIQKAYEETLADANSGWSSTNLVARENLQKGLGDIFNVSTTNIVLQDSKGKNITIACSKENLVPDKTKNLDYVRHIIDIDGMITKNGISTYSTKASVNDIPLSFMIRNNTVDESGNDELSTNTRYTFIGLSGTGVENGNLSIAGSKVLTGFNIPSCVTGKKPAHIDIGTSTGSQLYKVDSTHTIENNLGTSQSNGTYSLLVDNLHWYVDMGRYKELSSTDKSIVSSGNSIKLLGFTFVDPDSSIVKLEIEDRDGKRYPCSLINMDSTDKNSRKYIQVNELRNNTDYIFTNLYITSNVDGKEQIDSIALRQRGNYQTQLNTHGFSTGEFKEPSITLGAANAKDEVTLAGGLKVQAVKNDSTALRYILKVDNSNGNVGELRVSSLREGEKSKVQKIMDKKTNTNFYIVTLTNLTPDTDYNFVTLELDYTDFENKKGVTRVSLGQVNTEKTDTKLDNITESSQVGDKNSFQVDVVLNNTAQYPRSATIPVFIDDMNDRFVKMDYTVTGDEKGEIKAVYDGVDTINVTGLTPNKEVTLNLSFIYKDENGAEQSLKKYVQIKTPQVGDIDIISDTPTVTGNEVSIKLGYNGTPKSNIKSIVVKDEHGKEIGSAWDPQTNTITLKGLDANKDYSGLVATFTLENTNKINYPLSSFTTKDAIVKPTGKVADFVSRVYTVALGREPEVEGWNFWIDKLQKKEITATEFISENLMTQKEFIERELNKQQFVKTMYTLIVNREPDKDGQSYWERKYDEYRNETTSIAELRIKIAREMMDQPEFKELVSSIGLKY